MIPDSITQIDGHYIVPGRAAAYLLVDGDEAAFVDNITRFSIPYLLDGLKQQGLTPEQVRYVIVTHIHLDHSGGTAELMKHCPNATVLCHPRAGRHIVDPARLVKGATAVYGEAEFAKVYGVIEPIEEGRVRIVQDNERVALGLRTLTFLDTPGHAKHHHAILDSGTNSVFTGDAFGTCYPQLQGGTRPYFAYVCAPIDFDPQVGKASIQRIVDTGCDRIFPTHFGGTTEIREGAELLCRTLDEFDVLTTQASESDLEDDALLDYCLSGSLEIFKGELRGCGLDPDDATIFDWATKEHMITSQGIQVLAMRRRKATAESS